MTLKSLPTKAEYLRDVEKTKRERLAYRMIAKASRMLSELPEQQPYERHNLRMTADKYDALANECSDFLAELEMLRSDYE